MEHHEHHHHHDAAEAAAPSRPTPPASPRPRRRRSSSWPTATTFDLRIAPVAKRLGDDRCACSRTTARSPARRSGCREGSELVVDVVNEGDLEATVHWHGLPSTTATTARTRRRRRSRSAAASPTGCRSPTPASTGTTRTSARTTARSLGLYGNIVVGPAEPGYWPAATASLLLTLDDVLLEDGSDRAVQPLRDDIRGDGPVRQRPARRRRDRPRRSTRARARSSAST